MATHGTLRTDLFDASSIWEEEVTVLVPGPGFPDNPRDYRTETLRYPNAETIRELFRKLDGLQKATTFSPASSDSDTLYGCVFTTEVTGVHTLWESNPDDPANPTEITSISGAAGNAFSIVAVSGQTNVEADQAGDTLTLEAGANITITTTPSSDKVTIAASGSTGYGTVQEEGVDLTQRAKINFIGASVTAADDAVNGVTTVTITDSDTTYSAGTYLDLSGTTFNVDLTEVASYNGASTQVLRNDTGTIQWGAESGGGGGNAFTIIAVSGQSNIEADSATDTLTVEAGFGINLTTNAAADTLTIAPAGAVKFLIESDVAGASWNSTGNVLTPVTFTARLLSHVSTSSTFTRSASSVRVISHFTTPIEVTAGKARIALGFPVQGSPYTDATFSSLSPQVTVELLNVDCREVEIT